MVHFDGLGWGKHQPGLARKGLKVAYLLATTDAVSGRWARSARSAGQRHKFPGSHPQIFPYVNLRPPKNFLETGPHPAGQKGPTFLPVISQS